MGSTSIFLDCMMEGNLAGPRARIDWEALAIDRDGVGVNGVNCKIGERYDQFNDEVIYSVDVVRPKNSAAELRLDDLDNKFLEMGLCSACAGNVAMYYVKRPASTCARLAKQALEGNPVATDKLREFPDYCKWGW